MQTEDFDRIVPFSRVFYEPHEIPPFPDAVACPGLFIFSVTAQVVDNAVITAVQIDLHVFETSKAVVTVSVCQDDILPALYRIFAEDGVQGISLKAFDNIFLFLKTVIPAYIIVIFLPFTSFGKSLPFAARHHKISKAKPGKSGECRQDSGGRKKCLTNSSPHDSYSFVGKYLIFMQLYSKQSRIHNLFCE